MKGENANKKHMCWRVLRAAIYFKNASDVAGEKEGNPLLVAKQVRGVLKRLGMCWRGLGDRCI